MVAHAAIDNPLAFAGDVQDGVNMIGNECARFVRIENWVSGAFAGIFFPELAHHICQEWDQWFQIARGQSI